MNSYYENESISLRLADLTQIESFTTSKQDVAFYGHPVLGKVLVIDDEIQHVEKWQPFYHEKLVHLPASFITSIESVLIIGGGSLFAALEVLKYKSIKKVLLVDHDHFVLDLMARHYDHAKIVLDDRRFRYLERDAKNIDKSIGCFDLIINDCFDLSQPIFSGNRCGFSYFQSFLSPHGLCSDVIYRHILQTDIVKKSFSDIAKCKRAIYSMIVIPEYPGIIHLHVIWGNNKNIDICSNTIENKEHREHVQRKRNFQFQIYEPLHRKFYLYIPPYVKRIIESGID